MGKFRKIIIKNWTLIVKIRVELQQNFIKSINSNIQMFHTQFSQKGRPTTWISSLMRT